MVLCKCVPWRRDLLLQTRVESAMGNRGQNQAACNNQL
jgi:hypothetical protein